MGKASLIVIAIALGLATTAMAAGVTSNLRTLGPTSLGPDSETSNGGTPDGPDDEMDADDEVDADEAEVEDNGDEDEVEDENPPEDDVPIGAVLQVPGDFDTIQEAIDAAQPGDVVMVGAGFFPESLVIATDDLTLIGAGASPDPAVGTILGSGADPDPSGHGAPAELDIGILTTADGVHIEGFWIQHYDEFGILFDGAARFETEQIVVHHNAIAGIKVVEGHGGELRGLQIHHNAIAGFWIADSSEIDIRGWERIGAPDQPTVPRGFQLNGVLIERSDDVDVRESTITTNGWGVKVVDSSNTDIEESTASRNGVGVAAIDVKDLDVKESTLTDNDLEPTDVTAEAAELTGTDFPSGIGVMASMASSEDIRIEGSAIHGGMTGVWAADSEDIEVRETSFEGMETGIRVDASAGVRIRGNTFVDVAKPIVVNDSVDVEIE